MNVSVTGFDKKHAKYFPDAAISIQNTYASGSNNLPKEERLHLTWDQVRRIHFRLGEIMEKWGETEAK